MIRAVVWDLDDTLLDTSGLLIPIADTPQYQQAICQQLPLMPGAENNLNYLAKNYLQFLVTYGDSRIQNQKIQSLHIGGYFNRIYFAEGRQNRDKKHFFKIIPQEWGLVPAEILSIGNRRSTDIGDAKEVGYQTCLFSHGEHQNDAPLRSFEVPDYLVYHHHEIVEQCQL